MRKKGLLFCAGETEGDDGLPGAAGGVQHTQQSTGGYLVERDHSKQVQLGTAPCKFQIAASGQFGYIHTVGRKAINAQVRMDTRQLFGAVADIAQMAAVIACTEAVVAIRFQLLHKTAHSGIVGVLGVFHGRTIGVIADVPNGLDDQNLLFGQQLLVQIFRCSAIRRTGIVGAIIAAEILLTELAEFIVNRDILRGNQRSSQVFAACVFQNVLCSHKEPSFRWGRLGESHCAAVAGGMSATAEP